MSEPSHQTRSRSISARPFFVGTCRVHKPVAAICAKGGVALTTPIRTHSPLQTEQLARHLSGSARVYSPETAYLISDLSITETASGRLEEHWNHIEGLRPAWRSASVFVIEICSLREQMVEIETGRAFAASTFHPRDSTRFAAELEALAREGRIVRASPPQLRRLSGGEAIRSMGRIKAALAGRPVIWVSHIRPPGEAPGLDTLMTVRRHLAETVAAGAHVLGDSFFDPSEVAAELGAARFFENGGADLDHLSDEGAEALADRFLTLIRLAGQEARNV